MKLPSELTDPEREIREMVDSKEIQPEMGLYYLAFWLSRFDRASKDNQDLKVSIFFEDVFEDIDEGAKDLFFTPEMQKYFQLRVDLEYLCGIRKRTASPDLPSPKAPAPDHAPPLSGALTRIRWKGCKADLGRVFEILSPHLVDCRAAEWERHFMDKEGRDLTGACDIHKGGTSRRDEIHALASAARKMEPERD
jgi:hypothetical protein